jgi:tetratricopeptide (TPR) repeat protein
VGTAGAVALRLHLTPLPPAPSAVAGGASEAADLFATGFLALHDRGPPAELLLAVRAARRAAAEAPDNGGAYLLLGEAYLRLANRPGGQRWQLALPSLIDIRRTQALTALEQAALLRPDLDQAHELLAPLYYDLGQWDRALDHLRARLRIAEREARGGGPAAQAAAARRDALQERVETMEALVERQVRTYEANIAGKTDPSKVLDRAKVAVRHRLTRKALDMLLESNIAIFGTEGAQLQLDLMLQAGRAFEVRAWLEPGLEAKLGPDAYHWLQVKAAAACGDYAAADASLNALGEKLRFVAVSQEKAMPVRSAMALRVADAVLARPAVGGGPAALAWSVRSEFRALQPLRQPPSPAELLTQGADLLVLRGLLALEPGDVAAAKQHVRAAVGVWGDAARAAYGGGLDFPSRPLAQILLRRLEE